MTDAGRGEGNAGSVELRGELRWKNPALVRAREEIGLTQTEAAEAIGISNVTLNGYECLRTWPGHDTAQSISEFYGIEVGVLFPPELERLVKGEGFERKLSQDVFIEADRLLPLSACAGLLVEHPSDTEHDISLKRLMDTAVERLSRREYKILELHYGLNGGNEMTLTEIGKLMGLSAERIRQLRNRALAEIEAVDKRSNGALRELHGMP